MPKTSDAPPTATLECSPVDFEVGRAQLEANGYALVSCETHPGRLVLTGRLQGCQCDLCRNPKSEGGSNE